jgi:hypothetical protein
MNRTASAALKSVWFLQAFRKAVEVQIVHHLVARMRNTKIAHVVAFDGIPALSTVVSREGPHVGPIALVILAEAGLLLAFRGHPTAGARIGATAQQQRCGSSQGVSPPVQLITVLVAAAWHVESRTLALALNHFAAHAISMHGHPVLREVRARAGHGIASAALYYAPLALCRL